MKKTILLVLGYALLVWPSVGMAQMKCLDLEDTGKLCASMKAAPSIKVGTGNTWRLVGGSPNTTVSIDFEHGIVYLNGAKKAAGGAPPQPQTKHRGPKLTATAGGILVEWTDASSGTGIGYLIRAGATSGGEATTPITPSMIDVGQVCPTTASYCTYVDATAVAGIQKCYIVAATDGATRTSAYSSPDACFTIPLPALSTPVLGPLVAN